MNPFLDYLAKHPNKFKENKKIEIVEDVQIEDDEIKEIDEKSIVEEPEEKTAEEPKIESVKIVQPQPVQQNDISDSVLTNVVLMLNQILEELTVINEKIDTNVASLESAAEKIVAPPPAKRKIVLIRDENGKITGGDVIEVSEENK
jgi:hypothetical protein